MLFKVVYDSTCSGHASKKLKMEERADWWEERLEEILATPNPERFPRKAFKPTCPEVPILKDYSVDPGEDYWDKFPSNFNECGGSPFKIDAKKLERYVMEADPDFATLVLLKKVLDDIENGCDLAISVDYEPTVSENAPSCASRGPHISDMIAKGCKDKILIGP